MALTLRELERQLRSISHSEEAIQAVQAFSNGLAGTKGRLEVWNAVNAIVRKPIDYAETSALGFNTPDDQFSVLQGDIVQTEAAYFYGERIAGIPGEERRAAGPGPRRSTRLRGCRCRRG